MSTTTRLLLALADIPIDAIYEEEEEVFLETAKQIPQDQLISLLYSTLQDAVRAEIAAIA